MLFHKDVKTDLGTFNFPQTGWWVFHAAAMAGMYWLGKNATKKKDWFDE